MMPVLGEECFENLTDRIRNIERLRNVPDLHPVLLSS